ncbi:MAG TPA: Tm-1-like ATP-binding domain-containing protein [Planctomycetota bacterium]|nr:Tm-1-like ATP-binding domain-containing protein [Planctomycetota bacterium]
MFVAILATLDTKGREAQFVAQELARLGVTARLVDTSGQPQVAIAADVTREEVFAAAGVAPAQLAAKGDRGEAVTAAALGAARLVERWHVSGELAGVFGLGGSAGTTIGTSAMRALPIGVPKLMVSTLASGSVGAYVGTKDILMMNSVVDVSGINRISRAVLTRAAQAMAGMAKAGALRASASDKPLIAATMFGVTTPCVEHARGLLERAGFEVLVFHATGTGGRAMEALIDEGAIAGVLDVTTTELADELVGGLLSAGPERLTAAARRGVPQVISVGAVDMVNFYGRASVPERFAARKFHRHNENVTLMRTTPDENRAIGMEIGKKARLSKGPAAIFLPSRGVSAIDVAGGSFDDPLARNALFEGVQSSAGSTPVHVLDLHINDPAFAEAMANGLLALMGVKQTAASSR